MAQVIGKLSTPHVSKLAKQPVLHNDGGNLYLRVVQSNAAVLGRVIDKRLADESATALAS